ncbi:Sec-independent protein translocase subunit TatA [Pseudonocardia sp. GCM10023141]|uniref:Sec-independent protein translocase subunit TatA n=1 Tax=Pseudonocardia sp. GCM10023141 TaxID=3252653 RepID=UPI003605B78B
MGELSPWHWAIVIGVAVLLFGAKRLPDAARSIGRSARILRAELHGQPAAPEAATTTAEPAASAPTVATDAQPVVAAEKVSPVVAAPTTVAPAASPG